MISCVFPGVEDVLAIPLFPTSMLINDDFPTLDRPIKANSGNEEFGQSETRGLLTTNETEVISMTNQIKLRELSHRLSKRLNSSGLSIMGAWPHSSIQNKSESGKFL